MLVRFAIYFPAHSPAGVRIVPGEPVNISHGPHVATRTVAETLQIAGFRGTVLTIPADNEPASPRHVCSAYDMTADGIRVNTEHADASR